MSKTLVGGVIGGAACVIAAVVLVLAGRTADRARRDAAAREAIERREAAAAEATVAPTLDPADRFNWNWVGEVGWPVLDAVNQRCSSAQHCRDLPGRDRAQCFAESLPSCAAAVETLERTAADAPAAVAGLWRFRAAQERMLVCVYEQNLAAHRDRPAHMDRVQPGTSSEEHVGEGGAALASLNAAISRCMSSSAGDFDSGSTDRYLREHFGCEQVRADGATGIRQCCTPQRIAEMVATGRAPLAPDSTCIQRE